MKYAIIENGIVVNVAVASAEFAAQMGWILAPDAAPGDLYDSETGTFSHHEPEVE